MHNTLSTSTGRGAIRIAGEGHGPPCSDLLNLASDESRTGLVRPTNFTGRVTARRWAGGLNFVRLDVLYLNAADAVAFEHGFVPFLLACYLFFPSGGEISRRVVVRM